MANSMVRRLSQEKNMLLDEWHHSKGEDRLKLLVRLMDIDDELSTSGKIKTDGLTRPNQKGLSPMFQKRRRFKNLWLD